MSALYDTSTTLNGHRDDSAGLFGRWLWYHYIMFAGVVAGKAGKTGPGQTKPRLGTTGKPAKPNKLYSQDQLEMSTIRNECSVLENLAWRDLSSLRLRSLRLPYLKL